VGGVEGVVVAGGATGDDLVEFLPWETRQNGWKAMGKLNRGRGERENVIN